jgi:hypothetical protein
MTDTDTQHPDDDADLRRWLAAAEAEVPRAAAPEDLSALAARVHAGIAEEDARPLASVRQRPAWQRNLLGVVSLVVLVGSTFAAFPRTDVAHYPLGRLGLELGAFVAAFALCLAVATRGAHLPELPRRRTYGLAALAVLVVAAVGLLPPAHLHDPYGSRGLGEFFSHCGLVGVVLALPVYVLIRLLDRGSSLGALAAASAAGLAANTMLQAHCPVVDRAHMLLGHAMVGVWLLLGLLIIRAIERRRGL